MAPIVPAGFAFARYLLSQTGDPDPQMVTCGHQWDSGATGIVAYADTLLDTFATVWAPRLHDSWSITGVEVIGTSAGGSEQAAEVSGATVGGQAFDTLPSNCAMLMRKVTILRGRRNRGRCYFPGVLPESAVDEGGLISEAFVDERQGDAQSWFDALVTLNADAVILHSELPGTPTTVERFEVDARIATQRRRLR